MGSRTLAAGLDPVWKRGALCVVVPPKKSDPRLRLGRCKPRARPVYLLVESIWPLAGTAGGSPGVLVSVSNSRTSFANHVAEP